MRSKDILAEARAEFRQKFVEAMGANDEGEQLSEVMEAFGLQVQDAILEDVKGITDMSDAAVLQSRGARVLTSEETKYWQKVIDAMQSANPDASLGLIDEVLPMTVIDRVFENITEAHPLLRAINFQNTGMITRMIMSTGSGKAVWGDLLGPIEEKLTAEFSFFDMTMKKLSAWILVHKPMLDIGPVWVDRYVRTILAEAIALGLEEAIVDGDGKSGPIGMTRSLKGAVDGVYPRKTAIKIDDFEPVQYGKIINEISKASNDKRRPVPEVILVVNPEDYFLKVFPATTVRNTAGTYNFDVFPYPTRVVQSGAVPAGLAVMGLARRYFAGVGTSQGGRIEYSDEYKFLDDVRVYLTKLYGNGQPLDENAFVLLDIEGLKPMTVKVEVVTSSVG